MSAQTFPGLHVIFRVTSCAAFTLRKIILSNVCAGGNQTNTLAGGSPVPARACARWCAGAAAAWSSPGASCRIPAPAASFPGDTGHGRGGRAGKERTDNTNTLTQEPKIQERQWTGLYSTLKVNAISQDKILTQLLTGIPGIKWHLGLQRGTWDHTVRTRCSDRSLVQATPTCLCCQC